LLEKTLENKGRYNAIWQACENMENYFERNLRNLSEGIDWSLISNKELSAFNADLLKNFLFTQEEKIHGKNFADIEMDCAEILKDLKGDHKQTGNEKKSKDGAVYCKSIIRFSQLLIHALRIFLSKHQMGDITKPFHPDHLHFNFKPLLDKPELIPEFFTVLWQVRYQFDRWVMKRVALEDSEREHFRLLPVKDFGDKVNSRLQREGIEKSEHTPITQLQSAMYFASGRNAQYWLTPFLAWCIKHPTADSINVIAYLESVDNTLSLAVKDGGKSSFDLLLNRKTTLKSMADLLRDLKEGNKGTGFHHYWFQKLEYILWKQRTSVFKSEDAVLIKRREEYRIAARSSIEHLYAQNNENKNLLKEKYLHSFGNLALLSVSENSSLGNQSVAKKEFDLKEKPWVSLKLVHMFNTKKKFNNEWREPAIDDHLKVMLRLIEDHYKG
jgi:hypothetical protein